MLRYIYRFAQPMLRQMELVKSLLNKTEFSESEMVLCKAIKERNILVIDDTATSGSTLNEVLRALRILNEYNKITIFSLIGRKDLAIESID